MPLLVDPKEERTALQAAQQRPLEGFDPGAIERFKADYTSMMDFANVNARERSRANIQSEFISRFYQESGIGVRNWLTGPGVNARADLEANARGQFEAWKKENPESDLQWPDENFIETETLNRARASRENSVKLQNRSTGWGSAIGGFAGTAVGALRDPINAMSLAFGAGAAFGVLRTAMIEGAVGAASETAIQGINYGFKQEVDPNFGAGDALYEIGAAAAGGAVLGGGIKGIAAAWHRAKTGEWPRHIADAGNLVTREAAVPAARLDKSAQGSAIQRAAIEKASDDLFRGQPVEIPQEAFMQANARPGRVYDADGRSVGVQYEVVEADSLVTSNLDDMSANPAYPQELQPRDRTRAISVDQINSIAANLQPERLGPSSDAANGAPIVGPEGFVESGNGRVMAMRRAYLENGPASESYRNYLRSQNFDIEGFNKPVLVARRITDLTPEDRLGFVTSANRSTAMRLGAAEQALSDARLIDDAVLSKLRDAGDVDTISNRDFVRGFMQKLPRSEQGELVDKSGILSQTGERRVMAALMGRAYGEPTLLGRALEDADSNIKSLAGALGDSAGSWAIMRDAVVRGDIPRGMDITDDLMNAVGLVMRARGEGRPVADLINQAEMFGGPNEIAKILARAMFGDENMRRPISRKRLTAFLRDYADEALKNDAGARLFGEPLESSDVLRNSLAKADREDLIAVANDRLTPEYIDTLSRAPEVEEAVIMDAERLYADREESLVDAQRQGRTALIDDLRNLVEFARTAERGVSQKQSLGPVSPQLAEMLQEEAGINVSGYTHDIDADAIRHILKKHGEQSSEKSRGQLGITDADLEMIPEIIEAPDFIAPGSKGKRGQDIIGYIKRMDDGTTLYLEEARTGRKTLSALSMRKYPATSDSNSIAKGISPNVRNDGGDNVKLIPFEPKDKPSPVMVDLGDGRGERDLHDIMREADEEIAAAKEIEACTIGKASD